MLVDDDALTMHEILSLRIIPDDSPRRAGRKPALEKHIAVMLYHRMQQAIGNTVGSAYQATAEAFGYGDVREIRRIVNSDNNALRRARVTREVHRAGDEWVSIGLTSTCRMFRSDNQIQIEGDVWIIDHEHWQRARPISGTVVAEVQWNEGGQAMIDGIADDGGRD